MRLTFGKFNGARIDDVPAWYLFWLSNQDWFGERFPQLAEAVVRRLDALADDQTPAEPPTTALATDILKRWRRTVLAKWHPDRAGGSHAAFIAVNDAVESLSKLLAAKGVSA